MKLLGLVLSLSAFGSIALGQSRNPIGETAHYEVDRDRERTSSMILSGQFDAEVIGESETSEEPAYQVDLDYMFRVQVFGNQAGTESVDVPQDYFSEEFLAELRSNGTYACDQFTVDHVGIADAENMDGATYPMCDVLHFYNIDTSGSSYWTHLFQMIALASEYQDGKKPDFSRYGDIEDLQIRAHVKYGYPVLGAVKLDVSGYYNGVFIKAGADYAP